MTRARDLASGLNGVRPFAMAAGSGTFSITQAPQSGWYWTGQTVTFPAGRFTQAPRVALSANGPYAVNGPISTYATSPSTTSFTSWAWSTISQSWDYNWIATQMTSGASNG